MVFIGDLDKQKLLEELTKEEQKIETLKKQRSGLDSELDMEFFRRNQLLYEIKRRYEEGIEWEI